MASTASGPAIRDQATGRHAVAVLDHAQDGWRRVLGFQAHVVDEHHRVPACPRVVVLSFSIKSGRAGRARLGVDAGQGDGGGPAVIGGRRS